MLAVARKHQSEVAALLGYRNVEFRTRTSTIVCGPGSACCP